MSFCVWQTWNVFSDPEAEFASGCGVHVSFIFPLFLHKTYCQGVRRCIIIAELSYIGLEFNLGSS